MKIKVLQGINFENPITTIKIWFDADPETTLLEKIKNFHPVFMDSYAVDYPQNLISIQSKLPHLWKEIAPALNNYFTKKWTYEEAEDYALNTVIKNQVLSMSTIPILYAAQQLKYETTQYYFAEGIQKENSTLYNRYYCIGTGRGSNITCSISSTQDSVLGFKTQRDKWLTNTMIERLGLPIPKWEIIEDKADLKKVFNNYSKPFVLKPVGLTGGAGVTTNIKTLEQAEKAWNMAKEAINKKDRRSWQRKIMVQEQVSSIAGEDYRLLVIDGRLEIATKRIPANVIGDGKKSIRQLIEETNQDPRRDTTDPAHILKPIKFDEMLDLYLKEQSLTLDSVPSKNENVYVRKTSSMSQGGITEDVTAKVHPQIKYLVETIASSLHIFAMGADIMCKDISKPLTQDNGAILEVNSMPEAYLNLFPVIGQSYPEVAETFVKKLLKNNKTQQILYIGKADLSVTEVLRAVKKKVDCKGKTIGTHINGSLYINDQLINSGLEPWRAIEALKINANLDIIILAYHGLNEVKNMGTGFDRIDQVITSDEISKIDRTVISQFQSI